MRALMLGLSALTMSLAHPVSADFGMIESIGCGDLSINIDGDLSVTCEVANDTGVSVTSLVAKVEYLAAEALGPMASHVVKVESYQADGIPAFGLDWVSFPHPQIPQAYYEFRDPIIRVEILSAKDRHGKTIFSKDGAPMVLLDDEQRRI